ncbi:hypothetical protein HIM_07730 [Hirsutella minnesotensis 3608]|uniref:N-acetyltransferase domain-containing protein n=1 Tax=Hirsutella minnesotensis 3608 TaxID=1043627 RepID=A0A0F7ZYS2_9HYPO|nr:hypothetical protein HIM_07730 [Hirsutella minnesotensis 3608]
MTSELQMMKKLQGQKRIADRTREIVGRHGQVEESTAAVAAENAWPAAQCTLRQATHDDAAQIAEIFNKEAQASACPQIFRAKPIKQSDVRDILRRCQRDRMPFVVAMPLEEDMMDPSKWPKNSERAYREYVEFKKSHPSPPAPVAGAAFVSDARLGLLGSSCPGSRHNALVRIVVHPEYRRQQYGTALLDRVLLSLTPYHRSIIDYEWKPAKSPGIYEQLAVQNERQYTRIYMEMFCFGKHQPDYTWRASMLKTFNFKEAAYLEDAVLTAPGCGNRWLDLSLWQLEAQSPVAIKERNQGNAALLYMPEQLQRD